MKKVLAMTVIWGVVFGISLYAMEHISKTQLPTYLYDNIEILYKHSDATYSKQKLSGNTHKAEIEMLFAMGIWPNINCTTVFNTLLIALWKQARFEVNLNRKEDINVLRNVGEKVRGICAYKKRPNSNGVTESVNHGLVYPRTETEYQKYLQNCIENCCLLLSCCKDRSLLRQGFNTWSGYEKDTFFNEIISFLYRPNFKKLISTDLMKELNLENGNATEDTKLFISVAIRIKLAQAFRLLLTEDSDKEAYAQFMCDIYPKFLLGYTKHRKEYVQKKSENSKMVDDSKESSNSSDPAMKD